MDQAQQQIPRDTPDPDEARAALVSEWAGRVSHAREHWTKQAFKRMRADMSFAAGNQWGAAGKVTLTDEGRTMPAPTDQYVANITLRHIATRTAGIYGKNPKIVVRRKERMLSSVWDGNAQTLQAALQMQAQNPADPSIAMLIQDAMQTMQYDKMMGGMAKTLELLFQHEVDEQPIPFKVQMKNVVRRGLTTGVGYTKLGFQRVMAYPKEVESQLGDYNQQLATVERLSADLADGEFDENTAQAEQLRLTIKELSKTDQIVVREGLTFTYPHSTALIPDAEMQQLRGFVGCDWVAEEFFLTGDRIKEIYKIDVSGSANSEGSPRHYNRIGESEFRAAKGRNSGKAQSYFCVWEIYNKVDGLVYAICDGYPDFLTEPAAPDVKLERFYPWFAFVVNEVYADDRIYPPSDVELMRDAQMELNRSRQGLREHRRAARPKTYARKGVLSQPDKEALQDPTAHLIVELDGLMPQEKIQDLLQSFSGPEIDPRLYDTSMVYEDYLRTLGQQEANLGGTSGATATEASIAEGSRASTTSAVVDDLDEFLGELARAAGQVLLLECSAEKVKHIVGPGAVWPEMSREDVAREIYLDVEASSTGRPNKAQEVQVAQAIFPMLMQIPGISPEFMGKEMLRRMDDKMDLTEAFMPGIPSIMTMNRTPAGLGAGAGPGGVAPGQDPNAQGQEGANNAPGTDPAQVNAAPRPPQAPPAGPAGPL